MSPSGKSPLHKWVMSFMDGPFHKKDKSKIYFWGKITKIRVKSNGMATQNQERE